MKIKHEFKLNDLVILIKPKAAQELETADADIDWPVPVISQYGQRVQLLEQSTTRIYDHTQCRRD